MTRTEIAATLIILAAGVLGVYLTSARAVQADNWIYWGNQLVEVDFDDGTSIQYGYDENGNRIAKTVGNGSPFYTIGMSAGPGGTISPCPLSGSVSVIRGGDCTFTAMPNAGYSVSNLVVDGNPVGAVTGYTFTNVTRSHSISVSFTNTLPITSSVNGSGTISPASAAVTYGGSQTFTISPANEWYISSVVVDGSAVAGTPPPSSYTFTDVMEPHSIAVNFATNYTYSITTSVTGSGMITPTSATVDYGCSQTFAITPNTGYIIASVTGCGGTLSGNTYTTGPVTNSCSVSAAFATNPQTVTPSAGPGGSISPSTPQIVSYDGTTSFTVTPNTGYSISSVTGCGGTLSGNTYTTGQVTGGCSVSALFAINTYTVTPSAGPGGSISPSTPQTVNYDGTTSFTVTPNTGYSISSVTGCGGTLSGQGIMIRLWGGS